MKTKVSLVEQMLNSNFIFYFFYYTNTVEFNTVDKEMYIMHFPFKTLELIFRNNLKQRQAEFGTREIFFARVFS